MKPKRADKPPEQCYNYNKSMFIDGERGKTMKKHIVCFDEFNTRGCRADSGKYFGGDVR